MIKIRKNKPVICLPLPVGPVRIPPSDGNIYKYTPHAFTRTYSYVPWLLHTHMTSQQTHIYMYV